MNWAPPRLPRRLEGANSLDPVSMNFGGESVGGDRETPGRWAARSLLLIVCVVPSSRRRTAVSAVSAGRAETNALLAQREARKTKSIFMMSNKEEFGKSPGVLTENGS